MITFGEKTMFWFLSKVKVFINTYGTMKRKILKKVKWNYLLHKQAQSLILLKTKFSGFNKIIGGNYYT